MLRLIKRLFRPDSFKDWRSFLLYAAGEVLLVFIGITLAIWFNNQNEERKNHAIERQVLREMLNELQEDKKDMAINQQSHRIALRSAKVLHDFYIGKQLPDGDSLVFFISTVYRNMTSLSNTASFEYLKSKGLSIISDDSLRFSISHLYDFEYENLRKIEESHQPTQFYANHRDLTWKSLKPLLTFRDSRVIAAGLPDASRELDPEIVYTFQEIASFRRFIADYYDQVFDQIKRLEIRIEDYLDHME